MKIAIETKFEIGDEVVYNPDITGTFRDKNHLVKIKRINIDCYSNGNKPIIEYKITFLDKSRKDELVREQYLYRSLGVISDYKREQNKLRLNCAIERLNNENKDIAHDLKRNKEDIKDFKNQLKEMKKEELIIGLAGISTNK